MRDDCTDHGQKGDKDGYARTTKDGKGNVAMHRLAYCIHNGVELADIKGKVVRHKCDNTRCINKLHLELGTVADNNMDRNLRKRTAHKLTTEQVEAIRKEYAEGGVTQRQLGAKYGTTNSNISVIVNKKTRIHDYS